jgi:hypothetical protein
MKRTMRRLALLFTALIAAAPVAAQKAGSGNQVNDRLLSMPLAERATTIANNVGQNCEGTETFPMGVTTTGKAKGFAYWSVRCKDGRSFAIQIAPNAQIVVVDCQVLRANGKECFKKF